MGPHLTIDGEVLAHEDPVREVLHDEDVRTRPDEGVDGVQVLGALLEQDAALAPRPPHLVEGPRLYVLGTYIYMCVCVYLSIYRHIYLCMHIHTHLSTNIYIHIYNCLCIYLSVSLPTYQITNPCMMISIPLIREVIETISILHNPQAL